MASHVTVLDTSMRRVQIKTTPGKHLSDVLQEACTKWGLNPDQYTLKHNNKPLDLSNMMRHSGLASGAKLDLVQQSRSPSIVSVALQLPESEGGLRLTHKFPSNTPLWQILRQFEEGLAGTSDNRKKLNITQRGVPEVSEGTSGAGWMYYEQPVVQVMARELATTSDLQKTLAQLGLNSGSALLRLSFKKTERPLEEAMAEISQYFQAVDATDVQQPASRGVHAAPGGDWGQQSVPDPENAVTAENIAGSPNPPEPVAMEDAILAGPDADELPESTIPEKRPASDALTPSTETPPDAVSDNVVEGPLSRPLQIFSPSSRSAIAASRFETKDSDYTPDQDHLRLQQSRLAEGGRNQRLKSDVELEQERTERDSKLRTVSRVEIDVRLPDGWRIRSNFGRDDTGTTLHAWVRELLEAQEQPFILQYRGQESNTMRVEDGPKRLIEGYRLQRKQLITFVWGEQAGLQVRTGPVLKEVWRKKATELKVEAPGKEAELGGQASKQGSKGGDEGKEKGKQKGGDKEGKLRGLLKGLSKR